MSTSYCVVGGGISGLVAAYRLRVSAGPDASITLFDPADRLGGVLRTERVGGQLMDVGAEAFVARRPEVPALLAELGLGGQADRHDRCAAADLQPGPAAPAAHGHPAGHSGATGGTGRARRRRDDGTHARRAQPAVQLAARRRCRRSRSWSATGSASRWWPARWIRCLAGCTPGRRPPSACARPFRRWPRRWTAARAT